MPVSEAFLGLGFRSIDFLRPGVMRKGYAIGGHHEKQKQNKHTIITKYGDQHSAVAAVCG
jgi:hypothetical protein